MTPSHQSDQRRRVPPRTPGQTPTGRSRAQRARLLRRRVISGALALFVASWLLIAVVLASGHDPALAARKTATTAASAPTTTTSAASTPTPTTTTTAASTPTTTTAAVTPTTTGSTSGVTTRQS